MFGYVTADTQILTGEQQQRYKDCYCGLCRALRRRYGRFAGNLLSYDMTFLTMLLSSLYEPEEQRGQLRCTAHPIKKRQWWETSFTGYCADMNLILAYYNFLDNWRDDNNIAAWLCSRRIKGQFEKTRGKYSRQCGKIEESLERLRALESEASSDPDAVCNCVGNLMGEIFVYREDRWAPALRQMGEAMGRFIYMLDAYVDLDRDKKRKSYNPILAHGREPSPEKMLEILTMLIGDAAAPFEALPLVQDAGVLRNVLYSGIWTKFRLKIAKDGKNPDGNGEL